MSSGNKSSIRFLVVGDWGGLPYPPYVTPIETATARMMAKTASTMGSDFVLAVGDNFYYKGVTDVNDPRFQVCHTFFGSVWELTNLRLHKMLIQLVAC